MGDSGYSGTPLARKLGLKDGQRALLLGAPPGISEITGFSGFLSCESAVSPAAGRRFDYIHVFETQRSRLDGLAPEVASQLKPDGMIWISWPKKASNVPTTLTEDVLREIFLPLGLVDVKVCAVDAVWSGLKFVFRKEFRDRLS